MRERTQLVAVTIEVIRMNKILSLGVRYKFIKLSNTIIRKRNFFGGGRIREQFVLLSVFVPGNSDINHTLLAVNNQLLMLTIVSKGKIIGVRTMKFSTSAGSSGSCFDFC